jgi:NAD-dependent SIR2 family protein deacetylase
MLEKLKCERCGKEYRIRTISENRGKHLCRECISHCSVCGVKLPRSNYFGETASLTGTFLGPVAGSLRDMRRPWIGSGMCNKCFWKQQNKV